MSAESLYTILGVEKSATEDEMKKAYKKQALRLHPDRNFANVDEATQLFAKVQAAYDVLSDPQERAWYDAHGLNGASRTHNRQTANIRITTSDELQMYFDPLLYINRSPDDFFQMIDELFRQLNTEEKEAYLDAEQERRFELPGFGDRLSAWVKEVKPFYDSWASFSTAKNFAWCDAYRTSQAPDRRARRDMENRNKKLRDAAKKEFNETVRALVSFIKKRDPRALINIKRDRNKKAQAEMASKAQASRDRKANANAKKRHEESYKEQDWARVEDDEFFATATAASTENNAANEESDDDDTEDAYECVVCDRAFHTQKMLVAHEMSRKHAKAVEALKREMKNEGVELGIDSESEPDQESNNKPPTKPQQSEEEEEEEEAERIRPIKARNVFAALNNSSGEDSDEEEEEKGEKEDQMGKNPNAFAALDGIDIESDGDLEEESEDEKPQLNKKNNKKQTNSFATLNGGSDDNDSAEEAASSSTKGPINNRTKSAKKSKGDDALNELLAKLEGNKLCDDSDDDFVTSKKVGKAKQRKEKKLNAAIIFANKCGVCQTDFPTRNKLFEHARISGHSGSTPKKSTRGTRK